MSYYWRVLYAKDGMQEMYCNLNTFREAKDLYDEAVTQQFRTTLMRVLRVVK